MGCGHNDNYTQRFHLFAISFLFILISFSTQLRYIAEGRTLVKPASRYQALVNDEKTILRAQLGSRPPRCERRCSSCGHCEAIQVPTNPQTKFRSKNSTRMATIAYANGEDNSNYKPMSWKCKCGNFIFNP